MHKTIKIRELTLTEDPSFIQVEGLFLSMYSFMERHGLMIGLSEDGATKWIESIKKGLGRFGVLYIASVGGEIVGFSHGSIRLVPDYLGNRKVGVITHIYVNEKNRSSGIGEKLVKNLEKWFAGRKVHSVELQVLSPNQAGINFWKKLGYHTELVQCRKMGSKL